MAFSQNQKTGYAIFLVLIILLVGLHLSVAGSGHVYYKEDTNPGIVSAGGVNYSLRDYNQLAAFWIIAAGLTFFFSIALLIGICGGHFTAKIRHMFASVTLVLEFAIAVTVSITASRVSNFRHYYQDWANAWNRQFQPSIATSNDDLDLYYRLLIADAVITFVLQVVYLVLLYLGTLDEVDHTLVIEVNPQAPLTADRLR